MSELSSPFSTGGGGVHFEAQVQASFVALMLTGGFSPSLPCWPIVEIKLQGKIDGYDTDDLIVFIHKKGSSDRRKLVGQIKHSISITKGDSIFGEVIEAAWNDFNNPSIFTKNKDVIALITGPLNGVDAKTIPWLLNQARHTKNADDFVRNVEASRFSPSKSTEKLEAIQHHLTAANGGDELTKEDLYDFLRHFHLLGYDLGGESGVVISLLHSHISLFHSEYPHWLWPRIIDIVQTWNQDAGTITRDNLPEDIIEAFKQKAVAALPERLAFTREITETRWESHPDASYLALAVLAGSWNEKNENDVQALTKFLGIEYSEWTQKAREILHVDDSPLSLKNGIWTVRNRPELWRLLGSRILDQNLDDFKALAIDILRETDPAFELPPEERHAASIYGKVTKCSPAIRNGFAGGLALLGVYPDCCSNASTGKAQTSAMLAIREIFSEADWTLWASLNTLLPALAEAAPTEFLNAVDAALRLNPCPFDELFAQEGGGLTGGTYIAGLLWALEGLAWEDEYLIRVCDLLAELASHDPGGQWTNRPANSLTDILLPWRPHTLANIEKRKVAVETVIREWPDVGWNLLLSLLPNQHQTTSGTHKPTWREIIPEDWENGVTKQDYWRETSAYAELAVRTADNDSSKLADLIDRMNNLFGPAFDQLIDTLSLDSIQTLPEEQRQTLWHRLNRFTRRHRRHAKAKWSLPDQILRRIEGVAALLAPADPFQLYQELFSGRDFDLYEDKSNWREQQTKLDERRVNAIEEILEKAGFEGVVQFAELVSSAREVGRALATASNSEVEERLLPSFLDSENAKYLELASGYVWGRYHQSGWDWCDDIDKNEWNVKQIGQFLAYLPFINEAWQRADDWLAEHQIEYWTSTQAFPYDADEGIEFAIDKLVEHGRPLAAINCLDRMMYSEMAIDPDQGVRVLLSALNTQEPAHTVDSYHLVELIKKLQSMDAAKEEDLFKVEWAYIPLLDPFSGAQPINLYKKLATEPEFFCEIIQYIYRSSKEGEEHGEPTEEQKAIANNAYQLLNGWSRPPGLLDDGTFDEGHFKEWVGRVVEVCTESGHLEAALVQIGEVLIHAPRDDEGLWINNKVAGILNDRDFEKMRQGFRTALYNSRGVHTVDPSGMQEMELADVYRQKAEDVENAGFQRLATTLRGLSDSYVREAEQVRAEFDRDED